MGTYLSLFVLGAIAGAASAAGTSYLVGNEPQMYLDVSISNSQTTGIILASPQRNGDDHIFTTETGGVLRIRQGSRVEDIYYADATVNTSTNRVTLDGVTRNLCTGRTTTFTSCGNGQYFSRGAVVELSVDARLINLKVARDLLNTMSGSGQITSSQTDRAWIDANSVTTTQRDAFVSGALSDGNIVYNTTVGTMQYRAGGAWISFGSGSTINATEAVRGVSELATVSEQTDGATAGTTGAPLVVQSRYLVETSTGAGTAGRIPVFNSVGYLDVRAGGTGTGGVLTGHILIGRGVNVPSTLSPTANSGRILRSNGASWKPVPLAIFVLDNSVAAGTSTGASYVNEGQVYRYTFPANYFEAGDQIRMSIRGVQESDVTYALRLRFGGFNSGTTLVSLGVGSTTTSSDDTAYRVLSNITVRTIGASGTAVGDMEYVHDGNAAEDYTGQADGGVPPTSITVDTTAQVRLTFTVQFMSSNASSFFNTQQVLLELLRKS